jgi:hypothetical protein
MSLIPEPIPIDEEVENKEFIFLQQLRDVSYAAKNLSFTSRDGAIQNFDKAGNFNGVWAVFTSNGTANTEDAITHTLGRIPFGFLPSIPDKSAVLYMSSTAPTSTTVYFKSSVATVAWKVMLF